MKKNYCNEAADWWASKIQKSEPFYVYGLESFKKNLARRIYLLSKVQPRLTITTYDSSSKLLDEIAISSGLNANIPSGYEMRIILDTVSVYNSDGMLVAHF